MLIDIPDYLAEDIIALRKGVADQTLNYNLYMDTINILGKIVEHDKQSASID